MYVLIQLKSWNDRFYITTWALPWRSLYPLCVHSGKLILVSFTWIRFDVQGDTNLIWKNLIHPNEKRCNLENGKSLRDITLLLVATTMYTIVLDFNSVQMSYRVQISERFFSDF